MLSLNSSSVSSLVRYLCIALSTSILATSSPQQSKREKNQKEFARPRENRAERRPRAENERGFRTNYSVIIELMFSDYRKP